MRNRIRNRMQIFVLSRFLMTPKSHIPDDPKVFKFCRVKIPDDPPIPRTRKPLSCIAPMAAKFPHKDCADSQLCSQVLPGWQAGRADCSNAAGPCSPVRDEISGKAGPASLEAARTSPASAAAAAASGPALPSSAGAADSPTSPALAASTAAGPASGAGGGYTSASIPPHIHLSLERHSRKWEFYLNGSRHGEGNAGSLRGKEVGRGNEGGLRAINEGCNRC